MHSKTWHRQVRSYISFLLPAFVLYTIFWVLPILFNLVVSFSKWNGMTQLWKTKWVGFQNYTRMFKDNIFAQAITHNFEFTILSVVFIPTVAFLIAILIEKGIKRKGFFRTTLFIPAVLPMLLVAILFRWVFSVDNGMINSFLGAVGLKALETNFLGNSNTALLSLFSLSVWKSAPFYMVIILAGLQSVPHELEEAASIDGCSGAQSLRYITIPLLRPILAVVYGLVIIDGFRIFDLVFVTTKNGPANATIVMATYNYMLAFGDFLCGYAAALSNINVVVILIISVFYFHFSMRSNID